MTCPGLLLTGGASRRLGVPKAEVPIDGATLSRRAAAVLAAVCDPAIEVGPGVSGLRSVREEPPGSGPLAALVAGAGAVGPGSSRGVVLLACDLPFVGAALLGLVAGHPSERTVVPRDRDGRLQYTCARYAPGAIETARRLLAAGRSSLRALVEQVTIEVLEPEAWAGVAAADAFDDLDTPADFARHGIPLPGSDPGSGRGRSAGAGPHP